MMDIMKTLDSNSAYPLAFIRVELPAVSKGFTLVELLVVITIIVILLALLTPAMDRAVYQAELASCAARLHGIATGVTQYASGNNRAYPYRPTLVPTNASLKRPSSIRQDDVDDRPYLQQAMNGLDVLIDPLAAKFDLDANPKYIHVNYNLWFGMYFPATMGGGKPMRKLGDRLDWADTTRGGNQRYHFSVLASDVDWLVPYYTNEYLLPASQHVITSHPDRDNLLYLQQIHTGEWELSWWTHSETHARSELELNFALADGSVERWTDVKWDDDRMARVPANTAGGNWTSGSGEWIHLPPQQ